MAQQTRRGAQGLGRLGRGGDRDRSGSTLRDEGRRHRVPRLRHRGRRRRRSSALVKDGKRGRASARPARRSRIIANQTPFYGESGGQVGDTGDRHRRPGREVRGRPTPQKKLGDAACPCRSTSTEGTLDGRRCGRAARSMHERRARASAPTIRRPICCTRRCAACSATHVTQKGSLVAPDRLRFDFSPSQAADAGGARSASRPRSTP